MSGLIQLEIFLQVGSMTHDIYAKGFFDPYHLNKIKLLGGLILKLVTSKSNGKYQLLTRMPQAPCMLEGANVDTHFRDIYFTNLIQRNLISSWA